MKTRKDVIDFCKTFVNVYEDYPFHDENWIVMRCSKNKKTFAYIYEKEGNIWVNIKVSTEWIDFWRNAYPAVIPAYHMNKRYWNTIILNGTIPEEEIKRMIGESYDLIVR